MPQLELLISEYGRVCSGIDELEKKNEHIIGFILVVGSLGLTLGIKDKINEVFVGMPFVILALMQYFIFKFRSIQLLGGYKKFLEERINAHVSSNILHWEKIARAEVTLSVSSVWGTVAVGLVLVGAITYSMLATLKAYSTGIFIPYAVLVGVFVVPFIYSCFSSAHAFDRAYKLATEQEGNCRDMDHRTGEGGSNRPEV